MRYCPTCMEEYEDGVKTCAECNVELVTEDEIAKRLHKLGDEDPRDLAVAGTAEDLFEADAFTAAVQEAGIPVMARMRRGGSVDAITDAANKAWWEVLVPADQRQKAAAVMAERKKELEASEPEAAEAAEAEAEEAGLVKLTQPMKDLIAAQQCYVATVNDDGTPEIGPKRSTRVLDDSHLAFNEVTGRRTWANVKRGSAVAIAVADREARVGYRFVGSAEVITAGPVFEQAAEMMKKAGIPAPLKGVVKVAVEHVFNLGGPNAGEEIV